MDCTLRELSLLEEKNKLWRKEHAERVKRMEQYYDQEIANIEEEFKRAVQKLNSDFSAQRKAILRQNSGCEVSNGAMVESIPSSDETQPKKYCTRAVDPKNADSPETSSQTKLLSKPSTVSQSAINGDLESISHQERREITEMLSAGSPTAVSFVSIQSMTSALHKLGKKQIRYSIPKNEIIYDRVYDINPRKTTINFVQCFAYGVCVNYDDADQVTDRVPYPMGNEKQCMRGSKQSKHHRLKPLLFDPGGYRLNDLNGAHQCIQSPARKRRMMIRLIWDRLCSRNYNSGAVDGATLFHPCLLQLHIRRYGAAIWMKFTVSQTLMSTHMEHRINTISHSRFGRSVCYQLHGGECYECSHYVSCLVDLATLKLKYRGFDRSCLLK
ncbi:uncharacterized protein LOC134284048 [Aedes albopictus]|uniref:Uncharacterized protein n=1 Tax=Aedes albopictus TaxID=7160 RepID=A0ABM1Z0V9_AEDAL